MQNENQRIAALLAAYQPADAKEAADRVLIQQLLAEIPAIMDQTHDRAHVTGSALVMDAQDGRILLHFHKKLSRWLQFGGHAEAGEIDPAQTALREAREESGLTSLTFLQPAPLDVDVHSIPARGDRPEHLHLDFRYALVTSTPDAVIAHADESAQFRWFTLAEAERLGNALDPALHRLIEKAQSLFRSTKATSQR